MPMQVYSSPVEPDASTAAITLDEFQALHRVATLILQSHDLEEILLLITQEAKQLLEADICGILLREGDLIVMRRCVGHRSPDTAALRMQQGQGLAGRVFATGEPYGVDNYLESNGISRDFFSLAVREKVRSALGAPLLAGDHVIGVLEVWRRRPSRFTPLDTSRMVALANLASIAIQNAGLYAKQQATLRELAEANRALVERYALIQGLVKMQQDLARLLIDGRNLAAVAARAAQQVGAQVLILDAELRILGASPMPGELPAEARRFLQDVLREPVATGDGTAVGRIDDGMLRTQEIRIGLERIGVVVAIAPHELDEAAALALSQVAATAALHFVELRAASRARAETLEGVLWDLLEGDDHVRRAGIDRLREMRVEIRGPQRVVLCSLSTLDEHAKAKGWGAAEAEACKHRARSACEEQQETLAGQRWVGVRGNEFAFLVPDPGTDAAERMAMNLARAVGAREPGLAVHVGASAPQADAFALRKSLVEARTAVAVARQHGTLGATVFERGGVLGVLLGLREDADIQALVARTFGKLLDLGERHSSVLLRTLRVYFDCNCSQKATALHLKVHPKTVQYRLARIGELTGLDLGTREDRLLADLSLYAHELKSSAKAGRVGELRSHPLPSVDSFKE